jgi:hypothetical protein
VRYAKGTIAIREEQDLPVLQQVMNSQFISQSQLWEFVHRYGVEVSRKSFCWRLARLCRHGLVNRHHVPVVDRESVYSLRAPFNDVQHEAISIFGEESLLRAVREHDPDQYRPPLPDQLEPVPAPAAAPHRPAESERLTRTPHR